MYQIGKMPGSIDIGYIGETNFRKIEIDMSAWMAEMPDGIPSIVHIRPGEAKTDAYVAETSFDAEKNILTWVITAADIGPHEGEGLMQVFLEEYEDDDLTKRGKSIRVITKVNEAADDPSSTIPSAQETMLERMTTLKNQTVTAKEAAEDAQTAAETAEDNAEDSAEDAEAYAKGTRDGSAVASDDPAYHNNAKYYSEQAGNSATSAGNSATSAGTAKTGAETAEDNAEAWAKGTKDGTAVPSTDPAYHNNAKYYSEQAAATVASKADLSLIAPQYTDLTFPVSKGQMCIHNGGIYAASQTISTSEAWTAAHWVAVPNIGGELSDVKNAIHGMPPKNIPFIDNVWINSSGIAEQDNTYKATDFVELDGIYALSYTGKTGSSFSVFWYDEEKNFISASMKLNTRMAWFEDVIHYRPADAAFVRLQTQKITTPYIPEVTAYFDEKSIDELKENIIGDGVTDDTIAVQKIVNMGNSVVFPKRDTILITAPINIRLGKARVIDGNGCTLIADDDFTVLSVEGTLNTASDATLMDADVVKHEACALIENFRITAIDTTEGCGISLTKGFKTKLCNNYVHHMKNGIRLYGRNRDIIISENNIFAHIQNGILIDEGSNLHQINIVNNMIQYAHDNIHFYHTVQIANVQIVGNDIEIDQFPPSTYSTATCINFETDNTSEQFSEIEITGNTIQGHQVGQNICEFIGVEGHNIACMAFTGNHVSNAHGHGIKMAYVKSITISGNNYAVLDGYVYGMDGVCENININGETAANNVGGKIKAESTATLNEIKCKNVLFAANDKNSILTNNVTNVDIYDEKIIEIDSSTPSIVADPNALYMCGEVSTLSFTPCSSGDCSIVFTSGSTPTVLTVPNTVRWTDEFDPTDIESSATYKISVLNGELGTVNKWDAPQPQQYGGIPVLMDNCYYSSADAAIDSVNEDEGFFIAGPFDTGSIYGKLLTFTRFGSPKAASARLFNVYPPSSVSADYATIFRTDMQQDGIPHEFETNINGRYVVTSIRKQNAADFYIKDNNGNYLVKGNNVATSE